MFVFQGIKLPTSGKMKIRVDLNLAAPLLAGQPLLQAGSHRVVGARGTASQTPAGPRTEQGPRACRYWASATDLTHPVW